MILRTRNGKQVEVHSVMGDGPDDVGINDVSYVNAPGVYVIDSVCEYLQSQYAGELASMWTEQMIERAESAAELYMER